MLDSVLWCRYQLKVEMTNAFSCRIALRLISGFPQRSRQTETCRHFNCPFPDIRNMFLCVEIVVNNWHLVTYKVVMLGMYKCQVLNPVKMQNKSPSEAPHGESELI